MREEVERYLAERVGALLHVARESVRRSMTMLRDAETLVGAHTHRRCLSTGPTSVQICRSRTRLCCETMRLLAQTAMLIDAMEADEWEVTLQIDKVEAARSAAQQDSNLDALSDAPSALRRAA